MGFVAAITACLLIGLCFGFLARAGLPAWVGALAAVAAFGGDPADPIGALAAGAIAFVATALCRALVVGLLRRG